MMTDDIREAGRVASDAGALAQKAAPHEQSSRSTLGRIVETAGAVRVGARLLPAAWRLFKRYPVFSSLIIAGAVVATARARGRRRLIG